MNIAKTTSVLILILFFLSGCIPNATDPSDNYFIETQTKMVQSVEETVSAMLSTRSPTSFFIPSSTPSPIPSPSMTPNPYSHELISPDKNYIAKQYALFEINKPLKLAMEIWDSRGEIIHTVKYQSELVNSEPDYNMRIADWSGDSSKLFFYYLDGYSGWYTLFDGTHLQYIDMNTGEIIEIAPGFVAFDFSSDKNTIAYLSCCNVIVKNLISEKEIKAEMLNIDHYQAGWIHISPSGEKVLYHLLVTDYEGTAILFDTSKMQQIVIIDTHLIEDIFFEGWDENENPIIGFDGSVNVYDHDLKSMRLIATFTPYSE